MMSSHRPGCNQPAPSLSAPHNPAASSRLANSSAFSASANANEDWTKVTDLAERRRIQNRIAQRNYRKKLKRRLEDLEARANSASASPEPQPREIYHSIEANSPAARPRDASPGLYHQLQDPALFHPQPQREYDSRSPPSFEYTSESYPGDNLSFPSQPHSPEFHSYPMQSPDLSTYHGGYIHDDQHTFAGFDPSTVKQEHLDEQVFQNNGYVTWSEMDFPSYYQHHHYTSSSSDEGSNEHGQGMWSMYPPTPDLVEDSPPTAMGYFS